MPSDLRPLRLPLLVTGCGRSGTKYISHALQRLGLDVRHEQLGSDGISSWTMAVISENRIYGPPSSTVSFEQIFHQTRDPLSVINSCMSFSETSWDFICDHIDCPRHAPIAIRAATYWLLWNEEVEKIASWRYRIEDFLEPLFEEFCVRLKVNCNKKLVELIPRDFNTRKQGRNLHLLEEEFRQAWPFPTETFRSMVKKKQISCDLTWQALETYDKMLCTKVKAKAAQYGYAPDCGSAELDDAIKATYTKILSGFPSI